MQKISLITTVLNEEGSIEKFLESISLQTKKPDEVIIVDGGSADNTFERITKNDLRITKLIRKRGNRSVGRNEAIRKSSNNIIAVTDAGCILDKHWLERLIKPFEKKNVDVVAGYYKGKPRSIFQKCVIPYALVMPDAVNPSSFLPATRSMALRKSVWEKAGGFDEKLSHNEDYAFAKTLKKIGAKIVFEKSAVVYWIPRGNLSSFYTMIRRFAYGDAEAGIYRPKVLLIFLRYFLGLVVLTYSLQSRYYSTFYLLCSIFFLYFIWSVWKNYKYVKEPLAIIILPILQIASDIAVIIGTTGGLLKTFRKA